MRLTFFLALGIAALLLGGCATHQITSSMVSSPYSDLYAMEEGDIVHLATGRTVTEAELSVGDNLELTLPLPQIQAEILTAQVVHVADKTPGAAGLHVGIELVSPDPLVVSALSQYIWKRLRDLYPGSLPELREQMGTSEAG